MVKFSKVLEAQLISEWKDAFVNYGQLKKHVKKVKLSQISNVSRVTTCNHDYGFSIFDPFRSLLLRLSSNPTNDPPPDQVLQVKNPYVEEGGIGELGANEDEDDQIELVEHFHSEEDEVKEFFEKLDEELDKVNQFYINKESEFLERGEMLNKQLQILLDLQQLLDRRRRSSRCNSLASSGFLRSYSSGRTSDPETASEFGEETVQTNDVISALEKNGIKLVCAATRGKTKKGKPRRTELCEAAEKN